MRQIINAANALELDAGHVLKATATDEDDVVLLQIVSNAGDIRDHLLSGRKSHQNAFSVGEFGFRGFLMSTFKMTPFANGLPSSG